MEELKISFDEEKTISQSLLELLVVLSISLPEHSSRPSLKNQL
jgi:hypothetical protein